MLDLFNQNCSVVQIINATPIYINVEWLKIIVFCLQNKSVQSNEITFVFTKKTSQIFIPFETEKLLLHNKKQKFYFHFLFV